MPDTPTHDELLARRVVALELDRQGHSTRLDLLAFRLDALEQQILSISEVIGAMGTYSEKSASTFETLAKHINAVSEKLNLLRADLDAVARRT
jgi:chromosome segregation ATPase